MILSQLLKFTFHLPFAGKRVKNVACLTAFKLSEFDIMRTDELHKWIDDDSTVTISETGTYKGLDNIVEYINYVFGDYNNFYETLGSPKILSSVEDDSHVCSFLAVEHRQTEISTFGALEEFCLSFPTGIKLSFDLSGSENFIQVQEVFGFTSKATFSSIVEGVDSSKVASNVCMALEDHCHTVWNNNNLTSQQDCIDQFLALPMVTGDNYADGDSQACRQIHSMFVEENQNHCPHVSFVPMEDVNGKIKCQESGNVLPEDLFTEEELEFIKMTGMEDFGFDESLSLSTEGPCAGLT